ncbi:MAG: hypothetical protein UHI81_00230 [Olegusella sp.]|nr:hypothetical protein [Olegusella sp.]
MEIRLATKHDIDAICRIYEAAKQFMSANGNASQWDGDCPGLREAKRDVRRGAQMVAVDEAGEIVGCFVFDSTEDPDYLKIDGAWLNKFPYFTIHRLATLRQGEGVGGQILDWTIKAANNIRVDTRADNKPMQRLLESRGFVRCGTIRLKRGGEGIAYHFARPDDRPIKDDPFWAWKR